MAASQRSSIAAITFSWTHRVFLFIAISVGVRIYLYSRPCVNDPGLSIELPSGERIDVDPCRVFSKSYHEARLLFRREVKSLGLIFDSLWVVDDLDYTIDVVVIPGSEQGLVVHSSGVHGVEGFAGSAVQVAFLQHMNKKQKKLDLDERSRSSQEWRPLPDMPTVILVHAVNPFGMATYRRFNENNVDLNRNGLYDEELRALSVSHENHENYKKFDSLFNPGKLPPLFDSYFVFWLKAVYYICKEGFITLKAALVGGQYYQKKGLFYGGSESAEKSVRLLESWLTTYLSNMTSTRPEDEATVVTWIDLHTGLGPMGVDTLLPGATCFSRQNHDTTAEVAMWFSKHGEANQKDFKKDVHSGYEESKGLLIDYYARKLFHDPRHEACFICQEFGTVPGLLVAHAMILENGAYFSSQTSPEDKLAWAKRTTGRAFYPQSPAWRKAVLDRGILLLYQAMTRSSRASVSQQGDQASQQGDQASQQGDQASQQGDQASQQGDRN